MAQTFEGKEKVVKKQKCYLSSTRYNILLKSVNFFKMDRIWKSKSTFDPSTSMKPKLLLPNQISCRIIDLEIEIDDGGLNKETIIQLLHEYTVNCFLTSRKLLNFLKSGEMNGINCTKRKCKNSCKSQPLI